MENDAFDSTNTFGAKWKKMTARRENFKIV
jgi:hypothetical protein